MAANTNLPLLFPYDRTLITGSVKGRDQLTKTHEILVLKRTSVQTTANPTFDRWEIWCREKQSDLSEFTQPERGRFPDSSQVFFPASIGNNFHPLGTEPLPTSTLLATTQAKKEGKNWFWHPFVWVLWHSSLLPQYYCLSVNYSALPRLEYSIPGQTLT